MMTNPSPARRPSARGQVTRARSRRSWDDPALAEPGSQADHVKATTKPGIAAGRETVRALQPEPEQQRDHPAQPVRQPARHQARDHAPSASATASRAHAGTVARSTQRATICTCGMTWPRSKPIPASASHRSTCGSRSRGLRARLRQPVRNGRAAAAGGGGAAARPAQHQQESEASASVHRPRASCRRSGCSASAAARSRPEKVIARGRHRTAIPRRLREPVLRCRRVSGPNPGRGCRSPPRIIAGIREHQQRRG